MIDNFNLLAESLVLAGEELDEGIEFEGPNTIINKINKCKSQLNCMLYECAKSRKKINDILDYCIKDIENNENKLNEDERIFLESYSLEVCETREKINEELDSLSSKLNRIADAVLPDVWIGGEDDEYTIR